MCRMLLVHPSGFYAWLREPLSQRALEDQRQTKLIKKAWEESGEVYGYRQLRDKRGRPDASARSRGNLANPKVATFCAALWPTFALPLTSITSSWPTVAGHQGNRVKDNALMPAATKSARIPQR